MEHIPKIKSDIIGFLESTFSQPKIIVEVLKLCSDKYSTMRIYKTTQEQL